MGTYKHYIIVNSNQHIVDGWTSGEFPERDPSNDICIREDDNFHFRLFADGEDNPALYKNGVDLYIWDGTQVLPRPQEELDSDRSGWLDAIRSDKLTELSAKCNESIVDGCDVELPSGASGHISLTVEDQINIADAMRAIDAGAESYLYHLDGQTHTLYSADDIRAINDAANAHRMYHRVYFSQLSSYVKSCADISAIESLAYGDPLPNDMASAVNDLMSFV